MNTFAGGFDHGASQFAGGGFMASPAPGAADYGQRSSGNQFKRNQGASTLRAVTIKQVLKENTNSSEDSYTVDGIEVSTITCIGKVVTCREEAQRTVLIVNDGTGSFEVQMYNTANEVNRSDIIPGTYARFYGNLRRFNGKLSFAAYAIKPVQDSNEITYHFLQCIFQRLHLTQGKPPAASAAPGPSTFAKPAPTGPSYGSASIPTYGAPQNMQPAGTTKIHQAVLSVFQMPSYANAPHGAPTQEVEQELRRMGVNATAQQVSDAITFLINEGHLYSTLDDFHHKICGGL